MDKVLSFMVGLLLGSVVATVGWWVFIYTVIVPAVDFGP